MMSIKDENCQTKSELVFKLENLNEELLSNVPQTRSIFSWQTCAVALADIRGALDGAKAGAYLGTKIGLGLGAPHMGAVTFAFIGGCAVGAFDSYVAHQGLKGTRTATLQPLEYETVSDICKSVISDDLTFVDQAVVVTPEVNQKLIIDESVTESLLLEERYLNVGKIHNVILGVADGSFELAKDNNINNATVSSILESSDFQRMYNEITYKKLNNLEIDRDPLEEKVLNLFCDVFQQYSSKCSDVIYIINKYIEILENSEELSEAQLNSIKIGLATSLYSFNYWDKTIY